MTWARSLVACDAFVGIKKDIDYSDEAWDLLAEGDLDGAMASAQRYLDENDTSPEAYNLLGYIHAQYGDLHAALDAYETAIEFDSAYLDAMLNAGEVLLQLGDFAAAIERVDRAIETALTTDDEAESLLLKVDILVAAGRLAEANAVALDLPTGPFDSPLLDFMVGRARFEAGDHETAAIAIEQAAAGPLLDPDVFYYLGLVRESRGDLSGATAAFLQSREHDLERPRPYFSEPHHEFERRVQRAIRRLPAEARARLEGALVVVDDLPGAEIVSEGADPRMAVWVDELTLTNGERLLRTFVYQLNVERLAGSAAQVDDVLGVSLSQELERV